MLGVGQARVPEWGLALFPSNEAPDDKWPRVSPRPRLEVCEPVGRMIGGVKRPVPASRIVAGYGTHGTTDVAAQWTSFLDP